MTSMTLHSPHDMHVDVAHQPKGILKHSTSSGLPPSSAQASPFDATLPSDTRLSRGLSEKEIVLQNTVHNAGEAAHRRSSSTNARGPPSRRHSSQQSRTVTTPAVVDENSPRLKWDEANLYLTEQERDSTMKIMEPKTPFAKRYDPLEDEAEISALSTDGLNVDELDLAMSNRANSTEDEIPGLDLGEPELQSGQRHTPESEKRVVVDSAVTSDDDDGRHGEEYLNMTEEEREKHREFEKMRRKHYEMKNVKNLLGHPEDLDGDEDDDDEKPPSVPITGPAII